MTSATLTPEGRRGLGGRSRLPPSTLLRRGDALPPNVEGRHGGYSRGRPRIVRMANAVAACSPGDPAAPAPPAPPVREACQEDNHELASAAECWICRDSTPSEPLVRPCQCRGSMAGVHASCVESWVRCHRRAVRHELPHCPVCQTPYGGCDRRPGIRALGRQVLRGLGRQLQLIVAEVLRFAALGALLFQYGAIDREDGAITPIIVELALAILLFYKLAVLVASLPLRRDPPVRKLARCFFTSDVWTVARHLAELFAAMLLLGVRWARREMHPGYFVPVLFAAAVPLVRLLAFYRVAVCFREVVLFFSFVACMPALLIFEVGRLAFRYRWRLINPLDGAMHLVLSLLAVILCLGCRSRRPVAMLFVVHSVFLSLGLLDCATVRRLPWRDGQAWWCSLLIAVEAASIACGRRLFTLVLLLVGLQSLQRAAVRPRAQALFQGSFWWCALLVAAETASLRLVEVFGVPEDEELGEAAAYVWLALLCSLACSVNWKRCQRYYHGWQRRHSTFVLCLSDKSGQSRTRRLQHVHPIHERDELTVATPMTDAALDDDPDAESGDGQEFHSAASLV